MAMSANNIARTVVSYTIAITTAEIGPDPRIITIIIVVIAGSAEESSWTLWFFSDRATTLEPRELWIAWSQTQ